MMKRVVDKKSSCTSVDPGQTPASPRAAASEWRRQGCGSRQGRARKSWKVLPRFRRSVLTPLHAMMACCRGVLPKLPIKRSVSLSHRGYPSFWSSQQQNTVHQKLERIQCTLINPHLITAEKKRNQSHNFNISVMFQVRTHSRERLVMFSSLVSTTQHSKAAMHVLLHARQRNQSNTS